MTGAHLDVPLLAGAAVLLVAIAAVRVSSRVGVPSLLVYLGLGMILGEDVIGIRFDNADVARNFGLIALAVIVAEGGLTTSWRAVRPVLAPAVVLSTVGVAATIAVTAVAARFVLDVDWRRAALAGALLGSTDAAAVFSTLRGLPLPRRLVALLEAESCVKNAPVVIAVTLLSARHVDSAGHALLLLGHELAAGAALGAVAGYVAVQALRRAALPAAGLYPLATMAMAVTSYAAAASLHASGFLSVYVTALFLGNADLPHRRATLGFVDGVAWLAQIGLFVMLGVLATPSRLPAAVLPALAIGAVLVAVARPLGVVVSTPTRSFSWRDRAFVSVAGLRGAVPIVLATIPITQHVPGARRFFDIVVVLVAVFTLLQAPALSPLARRLGLVAPDTGRELDVEAAPLDRLSADLLTVHIGARSHLHGVEVWELRLPATAAVAFVVRAGHGFVPDPRTVLRHGDDMLVVTRRSDRHIVEGRIRAVGRVGRLAGFVDRADT